MVRDCVCGRSRAGRRGLVSIGRYVVSGAGLALALLDHDHPLTTVMVTTMTDALVVLV